MLDSKEKEMLGDYIDDNLIKADRRTEIAADDILARELISAYKPQALAFWNEKQEFYTSELEKVARKVELYS